MGPKLMNCRRPEQMDTKEFGKMVKILQILEEGRVPAKEAKNWRIDGEQQRITRKAFKRLLKFLEMEGLMAHKGLWNLPKEKIMKERGEFPNEEGNVVRECKAMHEEDFWSSWLREDEKSKEERKATEGQGEEEGEKRKREEETEENETVTVKRRCEGFVSVEAFEILSQG